MSQDKKNQTIKDNRHFQVKKYKKESREIQKLSTDQLFMAVNPTLIKTSKIMDN